MTRVVLASASPRRRELLAALLDDFDVAPSAVEETFGNDPVADAESLALAKARDIANTCPGAVVIGSDTIVFDGERAYGKPEDANDALAMWRALGGRSHRVVTGVAVVAPGYEVAGHTISEVELANLDDATVRAYVASGRPMDKAGAYAIQDTDIGTVTRLGGCYCSVMGLPLWQLRTLLAATGVTSNSPDATRNECLTCPGRPGPYGIARIS